MSSFFHKGPLSWLALLSPLICALILLPACKPNTRAISQTNEKKAISPLPESLKANDFTDTSTPFFGKYVKMHIPWQPWSEKTLETAKEAGRPILLHIGYSTCPFSRQFRHTCLNDPELISFVSTHFVCVLADAETDQEANHIALETLPGLGCAPAWPSLLWLTPEGNAYHAHNFATPRGFEAESVMNNAKRAWKRWEENSEMVTQEGASLMKALEERIQVRPVEKAPDLKDLADDAYASVILYYDEGYGTISPGQNFPRATAVSLCFTLSDFFPAGDFRRGNCHEAALNCLRKMAAGAMLDPLDHCFHRYSEKPSWNAPHSEKLSQDQAILAKLYLHAAARENDASLRIIAFETLDELEKTWMQKDGLIAHAKTAFSTTHAPSESPPFLSPWFTWSAAEIEAALEDPARKVAQLVHGIRQRGNMPPALFSKKFGKRANVLGTFVPLDKAAQQLGLEESATETLLAEAHDQLRKVRAKRKGTVVDARTSICDNAFLMSALCQAAAAPGGERFRTRAENLHTTLVKTFLEADGTLKGKITWKGTFLPQLPTHLDYALTVQCLLDVHELSGDEKALALAKKVQTRADALFFDTDIKAYRAYLPNVWIGTEKTRIIIGDAALPSGNAIAAKNHRRFASLGGGEKHEQLRTDILRLTGSDSSQNASARALVEESLMSALLLRKETPSSAE